MCKSFLVLWKTKVHMANWVFTCVRNVFTQEKHEMHLTAPFFFVYKSALISRVCSSPDSNQDIAMLGNHFPSPLALILWKQGPSKPSWYFIVAHEAFQPLGMKAIEVNVGGIFASLTFYLRFPVSLPSTRLIHAFMWTSNGIDLQFAFWIRHFLFQQSDKHIGPMSWPHDHTSFYV